VLLIHSFRYILPASERFSRIFQQMKLSRLFNATTLLMFLLCLLSTVHAQGPSILHVAKKYSTALRNVENGRSRETIESLFRKGKQVSDKLDEMENLGENDYTRLQTLMRGYTINREEVLFIEPDSKFFDGLSRRFGTAKDVRFFGLRRLIKPDDAWAAYIEQQTDVTGCTIYGNRSLTSLYGRAVSYRRAYPNAYSGPIQGFLEDILLQFSDDICSCGSSDGVLREFRLFVKRYARDKHTPGIRQRLNNLDDGKGVRINCQTG
jgi:hypothetical protein